jgi:uncharacterized membrane protein (TIGR02234 family)
VLGVAVLVLAVAALALWGASAATWASQRYQTPFTGVISYRATGAALRPELVPLALVALASIAAVLATGRWLRRVLGGLLVVIGLLIVWRGVAGPTTGSYTGMPAGSSPVGEPSVNVFGPVLMVIAGVVLLASGYLIARYARRMPEMGAKYAAPGTKPVVKDPDKQLWDALDQGEDPTDG